MSDPTQALLLAKNDGKTGITTYDSNILAGTTREKLSKSYKDVKSRIKNDYIKELSYIRSSKG